MDPAELQLRTFLIDIGEKLSNDDRVMLTFLLANDVPRRDLDNVARDSRTSMNVIWEALINRQKITSDNVDYLINCFTKIRRMDLVQQLKRYSTTTTKSNTSVEKAQSPSDLFIRHDP